MNFSLFFLLIAVPLILPFILRLKFHQTVSWKEIGVNVAITLVAGLLVFAAGSYSMTADTMILNGRVTDKEKNRVSCSHSYSCRCRTVTTGKTTTTRCDTCYDHPYDIDWDVETTVGNLTISRVDRQGLREPPRWTQVVIGEPASRPAGYTNYIKGAPDSLFHLRETLLQKYPHIDYPEVYDYYRINRVINKAAVPGIFVKELNDNLNEHLKSVGAAKEVNIVFVFTKDKSPQFAEAVRQDWLGGKKNDVVVVWSVDQNKTNWVKVFSWSKKSIMDIRLTDALSVLPLDAKKVADTTRKIIVDDFVRRPMSEFEYLKDSIQPPMWALITTVILSLLASLGFFWYSHQNDVFGDEPYRRRF